MQARIPRNVLCIVAVLVLGLLSAGPVIAGDLDDFLSRVDARARRDPGSFRTDLRLTFGVSGERIDGLFEVAPRPSDVYMLLRIGEIAGEPVARVVEVYKEHPGQGWGVIAKSLGIKPGSDEFHALKKEDRLPAH